MFDWCRGFEGELKYPSAVLMDRIQISDFVMLSASSIKEERL